MPCSDGSFSIDGAAKPNATVSSESQQQGLSCHSVMSALCGGPGVCSLLKFIHLDLRFGHHSEHSSVSSPHSFYKKIRNSTAALSC